MVRKMLISMGIMSIIIFLFLYIFVSSATFGKIEEENKEITYSFNNDQYYYYLTDQEIESAITEGTTSLNSLESYLLPEKNNSLVNKEDILFSYIETPKLTIKNIARTTDHQYGRNVRTSEAKLNITDQYLPIVTRFQENKGYIYDVFFMQGEEKVTAYTTEVKNNGEMITTYFLVEDIEFEQAGELHLVDSLDEESSISFQIDFSSYH